MQAQRHLTIADAHVPHQVPLEPVLRFASDVYKPTDLILNGDFLNIMFASHWNEPVFKRIGLDHLEQLLKGEIDAGKAALRDLRSAVGKQCRIWYVPGNHEFWLYWMGLYYPGSLGIHVDFESSELTFKSDLNQIGNHVVKKILDELLETQKVGVTVLPCNEPLKLGKLTYMHGHQFTSPTAMHSRYPDQNLVIGHFHTEYRKTLHNSGDPSKVVQHTAIPCYTKLSPYYLRDKSTQWLNGVGLADVAPNGLFDMRVKKLLGGKLMLPEDSKV